MALATLYCPLCAQPVSGAIVCPTCGLDLVTHDELRAIERDRAKKQRDPLDRFFTLRRGKGGVLAGAFLCGLAFFAPWFAVSERSFRGIDLAPVSSLLWMIPAAALTLAAVVVSRRTVAELAGARAVALLLSLVPLAVTLLVVLTAVRGLTPIERTVIEYRLGLGLEILGAIIAAAFVPRLGQDGSERPRSESGPPTA